MKRLNVVLLLFILVNYFTFSANYYVSLKGDDANNGSFVTPFRTLISAINRIEAGDYIYMRGGTYSETVTITILTENKGNSSAYKHIFAYENEAVILDFSSMEENSSYRGIQLYGDYWHIKGIIIQDAGDNGMSVGGNYNIVENCIFRRNHDTGLQLSRNSSSLSSIDDWPSHNIILNCESYDNSDSDHEDADGFAAKLTCGVGNVFQNCVSHNNIDDGWDLYTKTETGPIGPVTLINCIAHSNGTLTDGGTSGNGDKNGFKLGGEDIPVDHIVRRCVAFNNGKHGFTYNRNLGSIEITNCTGYNNADRNFSFDGGTSVFTNNLSYKTSSNDKLIGTDNGNNVWDNDNDPLYPVSDDDFVTLVPGDNAEPYDNGFLQLKSGGQLIDKGKIITGIEYSGSSPDIGAFEYGGSYLTKSYVLTVSVPGNIGGQILISPQQMIYDSGSVVTLTAVPDEFYYFAGWSGDYTGTDSLITINMDENKNIVGSFATDKFLLSVYTSGPGIITLNPDQKLFDSGSTVTLTAIPETDCDFIGWTGDTITENDHLTLTINKNISVTGIFQRLPLKELIIQFESSEVCSSEGATDNKHTGYHGTGFFDFTNAAGSNIEVSVDARENTVCNMTIRYAHGKTDERPMAIEVNEVNQIESLDFPSTGDFTTWSTVSCQIYLTKGNNKINFVSLGSEGGTNFDEVTFSCADSLISLGDCQGTTTHTGNEYTLLLYSLPENGGDVAANIVKSTYSKGEEVIITATPKTGYQFSSWSNGITGTTNPVTITIDNNYIIYANFIPVSGIKETIYDIKNIHIYPNPASNILNIAINNWPNDNIQLTIYDLSGKEYVSFKGKLINKRSLILNIEGYPKGMYILKLNNNITSSTEKFIIE